MKRREFCAVSVPGAFSASLLGCSPTPVHVPKGLERYQNALVQLERGRGRLGVAILDAQSGASFGHRLDERFALCSTFKLPLAAMVLQAADQGRLSLDTPISYSKVDIVPHAPVTEQHLAAGSMTVGQLARAGQVQSDNVAANLLLRQLGGPAGFTRWCRQMGDEVTRLDRLEPELNVLEPGDERDTTTPRAMTNLITRIFTRDVLSEGSRGLLQTWMRETMTGSKRLRSGFPPDWLAGDKTGTSLGPGLLGRYNDVACAWFTQRAPMIVSCYFESPAASADMRDEDQAVLAKVGYIAARWAQDVLHAG